MDHRAAPDSRASLLDLIARAEADPASDEAHFLRQLRAAIAGVEGLGAARPRPDLRIVGAAG
jgi:hypothetical protein